MIEGNDKLEGTVESLTPRSKSKSLIDSPKPSSLETIPQNQLVQHSPYNGELQRGRLQDDNLSNKYTKRSSSARESSQGPSGPKFHRLLSSHYVSVTNPNFTNDVFNSTSSLNEDEPLKRHESFLSFIDNPNINRQEVMNEMRPIKLIGNIGPLASWKDYYVDTKNVTNKGLRKYYQEQNALIEKYQEIDNFLDSGKMHVNMLTSYGATSITPSPLRSNVINMGESISIPANKKFEDDDITTAMDQTESKNSQNGSRLKLTPGNIDSEGAQFLNYNQESDNKEVVLAIMVNFFINFVLLLGKLIVTFMTNSMSVVASLVDSILDFLSTFIIYVANRLSNTKNWQSEHLYPVGRSRLEPIGILVFSIIIIISFLQVGQESIKKLIFTKPQDRIPVEISFNAGSIMVLTIVCKIGCWIWCSRSKSSSVQALAQDAETDIIFNFISLLMPTLGYCFNIWWFDPAGALFLSLYIIWSWCATGIEHINNLAGAAADPADYKVILYLAYRFAEPISEITALKAYHVGDKLNVEIDLIFASGEFKLSMQDRHDIAEALQYAIETLPMVERAYVHIDHMQGNFKGHLV